MRSIEYLIIIVTDSWRTVYKCVCSEEYERQEMQTVDSAKLAQAKFSFNQVCEFSVLLLEITLLLSKWRGTRKKGNADRFKKEYVCLL